MSFVNRVSSIFAKGQSTMHGWDEDLFANHRELLRTVSLSSGQASCPWSDWKGDGRVSSEESCHSSSTAAEVIADHRVSRISTIYQRTDQQKRAAACMSKLNVFK